MSLPRLAYQAEDAELVDGPYPGTTLRVPRGLVEFRLLDETDRKGAVSYIYYRLPGKSPKGRAQFGLLAS